MDQPTGDGINTYYAAQAARAGGVTVALSGLGGDELFGGYPSFQIVPRLAPWIAAWRRLPRVLRNSALARLRQGDTRRRKLAVADLKDAAWVLQHAAEVSRGTVHKMALDAGGGIVARLAGVWSALRAGPRRVPMLRLGALYAGGFLLLMGASTLIDGGLFASVYLGGAPLKPELVQASSFQTAMWATMLLYLPLSMLFWHAPALVYWQGVAPVKSLFFSWMGCWRNKGAFVVYLLVWAGVFGAAAVGGSSTV